ncbi:MAG: hypothetical protein ACREKM_03935, partial [Longimicrobiales bacterium]
MDIDAPIGVAHPALKFALLALTTPIIEHLRAGAQDGDTLSLSATHESAVRVRVQAPADALPDERAQEEARVFLRHGGGRIEAAPAESSIYVVLPRVTGT